MTAPFGLQTEIEPTEADAVDAATPSTTVQPAEAKRYTTTEAFVKDPLFPFVLTGVASFVAMTGAAWALFG